MAQTAIQTYVQNLYRNVLQREGDAGGTNYWIARADAAVGSIDMAHGFIGSAEAQNVIAVLRLYDIFFDRAADSSGLKYWVGQMQKGMSVRDVALSFSHSSEFNTKYGNASAGDYVEALYANLFERGSDAAGKAYWVALIDSGKMDRTEVALAFTLSPEAKSADGAATRFAESYLALRSSGRDEPSTAAVEALAQKSLLNAITETQTIKGTVQNGIIQDASVFRDANGDGLPDGASLAKTDASGNFTVIGGYGDIVVTGGTDLTTGKANDKVLTTTVGGNANVMVTPLTSVINAMVAQGISTADAMKKISIALGLNSSIDFLSFNHTAAAIAGSSSPIDQQNAVAVKGVIAQLTILMENTAGLIKGAAGSATNLDVTAITSSVAKAVADKIISATANVASPQNAALVALDSQSVIKEVVDATVSKVSAASTTPLSTIVVGKIAGLASDAARVIGDLNTTVASTVKAINLSSSVGTAKAIDAFSIIAKTESLAQDKVQAAIMASAESGSLSNVVGLYTGSNLGTAIKAEQIGEIAKGVNGTSGGTVMDQVIAPPPSPPEYVPDPVFTVTESAAGSKIWTLSTGNGNVVVTDDGTNYVFTPASGTARSVAKTALNEVVVSTIALSGAASVLKGITKITGAVTVSDTGSLAAADLKAIEAAATGLVSATGVTSISSSLADATFLLVTKEGTSGDKIDMRADVAVVLSETGTVAAADVVAIDAKTTGNISLLNAVTLDGALTNVSAIAAAKGTGADQFNLKADVDVTLSGTTLAAADLITVDAKTAGKISAADATTLSGTLANVKTVMSTLGTGANQFNLKADIAVVLSDTITVSAADLIVVDGKTTGNVSALDATGLSGTLDQVLTVLSAKGTGHNQYNVKANLDIVLSGSVDADSINEIDFQNGSGSITFNGTAGPETLNFLGVTAALTINGKEGADILRAGSGADIFIYNYTDVQATGIDQISSFNRNVDKVRVSLIGSNIDGSVFDSKNGIGDGSLRANYKAGNILLDDWSGTNTDYVYIFTQDATSSAAAEAILINIGNISPTAANFQFDLTGTNSSDMLKGSAAADTINGGKGTDTLTGGGGADTFVFAATAGSATSGATFGQVDVIVDFLAGTDKLQFSGVTDVASAQQNAVQSAVTALTAGSSTTAIATAMATANTTNLGVSFAVFEGNTYVLFERTGSGTGVAADDIFIKLTGVSVLPTFAADVIA